VKFSPPALLHSLRIVGLASLGAIILLVSTESAVTAASTLPSIPDAIVPLGGKGLTVNLNKYIPFPLPQVSTNATSSNTVLVSSSEGSFVIQLFPTNAPATVANFLNYVTNGLYNDMFIDRETNNFFQTGGYLANSGFPAITNFAPVTNEAGLSNVKGTLAMLLDATNPNSATSQWFVNTTNNSALYDKSNTNGNLPFTVFGQVLGTNGMAFVNTIAKLPTANLNALYSLGSAFEEVPLQGWAGGTNTVYYSNLVRIYQMQQVALPAASATSSDPNSFSASIQGNNLIVTPLSPSSSPVTITVIAADTNGNASTLSFQVSTGKLRQAINFPVTEINYSPNSYNFFNTGASASSSLGIDYLALKSGPASFTGGLLYFKSPGVVTLTATQSGNFFYDPASATSYIIVDRAPQNITFPAIPNQTNFTVPYNMTITNATSSVGLPVSISAAGPARIAGTKLTISGAGTITLTAKQPGNPDYYSATPVTNSFTVTLKQ